MPTVRVITNDETCCGVSMPIGNFTFSPNEDRTLVMTPEEYSTLKGFAESHLGGAIKSVEKLDEPSAAEPEPKVEFTTNLETHSTKATVGEHRPAREPKP